MSSQYELDIFNNIISDMSNLNTTIDKDTIEINNNEKCLISDNDLESNHITLDCGHKFNYICIYREVAHQKIKKIGDNSNLKLQEIKCPYCRQITNNLLPYYKYYSVKTIRGVNYPYNLSMKTYECEYVVNSNKKLLNSHKCCAPACLTKYGYYCNKHMKYTKKEKDILSTCDNDLYNYYKKKSYICLKMLLKLNNCKQIGRKDELINRILIHKQKNKDWKEDSDILKI